MNKIAICIILILLIQAISVKADNPDLSFQGEIGFIELYSNSSIIKFYNSTGLGNFSGIKYTNVAHLKVNNSIIQNENKKIIIKLNESSSSSYNEKLSFTNVTLDLGLSNLYFKKGKQQNYYLSGKIIYASSLSANSEYDNIIYSPKEYNITINGQRIDSQIEIGIDENTNIKIFDKIELWIHDTSGFNLDSDATNEINIEWSNGDLRYKTHHFRVTDIDSLEITKSYRRNSNYLMTQIINDKLFIKGDVDKVELSDNNITISEWIYLLRDDGTIISINTCIAIINIIVLLVLAILTGFYARSTKQIVDETRKERKLNFIEHQLEKLYYPLDKIFATPQNVEKLRLLPSVKSFIGSNYMHVYLAEDNLKKSLQKLFVTLPEDLIMEDFENIPNLIKEDIEELEKKLVDLK